MYVPSRSAAAANEALNLQVSSTGAATAAFPFFFYYFFYVF